MARDAEAPARQRQMANADTTSIFIGAFPLTFAATRRLRTHPNSVRSGNEKTGSPPVTVVPVPAVPAPMPMAPTPVAVTPAPVTVVPAPVMPVSVVSPVHLFGF